MKVFVIEDNYVAETPLERENVISLDGEEEINWYLIADSAVTNTGKPFYLPEGYGKITVSLSPALRISRLGKSIAPKFASRYYSEYAPSLHFMLPQYKESLKGRGISTDAAFNFDKSLFIGNFHSIEELNEIQLNLNGEKVATWHSDHLKSPIDRVISKISRMNTLKMGDMLITGLSGDIELQEDDKLEVFVNDSPAFQVKVK